MLRRTRELAVGDVLLIVSPGSPIPALVEEANAHVGLDENPAPAKVEVLTSSRDSIVPLLKRYATRRPLVVYCDGGFWVDEELRVLVTRHLRTGRRLTQFRIQPGYFPIVMSPAGLRGLNDNVRDLVSHCAIIARSGTDEVALSEMDLPNRQIYLRPDEPETLAFLRDACARNLKRSDLVATEDVRQFWVQELVRSFESVCIGWTSFAGCAANACWSLDSGKHDTVMRELLEKYGVARYWALTTEPLKYKSTSPKAKISRRNVQEAEFLPNSFDLIFSLAFLERAPDPAALFEKVRNWVAPSGFHYGLFEIWSSARGHHVFPPTYPALKIPEFGHLYLNAEEMRDTLTRAGVTAEVAAEMVQRIYDDGYINRVGLKEFLQIIANTRMEIILLDGRANGIMHPKAKQVSDLLDHKYSAAELSAFGLEFLLRKSAAGLELRPRPGPAVTSDVRPAFIQYEVKTDKHTDWGPDYDLAIDLRKLSGFRASTADQSLFGRWLLRRAYELTSGNILLFVPNDFPVEALASARFSASSFLGGRGRLRVAVEQTPGKSIIPAMKRHSSGRPMVLYSDGGFWIDDELRTLVGDHTIVGSTITFFRIQPGYFPIVMTCEALLGLQDNLRDVVSYVSTLAKAANSKVRVAELDLPNRQIYLKPDEPEALDFLRTACTRNLSRTDLNSYRARSTVLGPKQAVSETTIGRLDALCDLRGKRLLELGCAVKHDVVVRELLEKYDIRTYCGVNMDRFEYAPAANNVTLLQQDVLNVSFRPNSFDLVFSFAFLEHAPEAPILFSKVDKWLQNGGFHYGMFEIWSSARGHHIYSPAFPSLAIPEFGHLYLSKEEMRNVLTKAHIAPDMVEEMLMRIYDKTYINRLGAREYLKIIDNSHLDILLLDGRSNGTLHPQATKSRPT